MSGHRLAKPGFRVVGSMVLVMEGNDFQSDQTRLDWIGKLGSFIVTEAATTRLTQRPKQLPILSFIMVYNSIF